MVSPDSKVLSVGNFWGPRKCEPPNVSRVFWMRDDSCKLCYDCDSQFTLFNRRHHCRICGKVFCSRCTTHSIPSASEESNSVWEEKVRVCNFCFTQWEQGLVTAKHETGGASSSVPSSSTSAILSSSPSAISLVSFDTSFTGDSTSTVGSMAYPTGSYEHITYGPSINLEQSSQIGQHNQAFGDSDPNSMNSYLDVGDLSLDDNSYGFFVKRNGTEEYSNGEYYGASTSDENDHIYRSCKGDINGEGGDRKVINSLSSVDSEYLETIKASVNEPVDDSNINGTEAPVYESSEVESVDSEKNADLWDIPPPEDKDADIEADLSEDRESDPFDDEDDGDAAGEWGYQSSSSSVAGGELQQREKANEEHRRALKNVVRGHLRALITQLLQGQNLPFQDDYDKDCWLEIITNLSWDAAFLLKPDMTKGSGMDPCGYVKVKCLACGKRSDSVVIKGVVCKKNVAHRRMTAKFDRPRLLILGGALEYQRVSNHLSSFDTLLQQEMDHLKMAVTKISAHNPNILLVEKSVSRFAQEYLLEKNISLVLNIKRPLLERIARCTGAEILPSLDSSQSLSVKKIPILGKCDSFHVEKYFEEHGSADQGGKKLTKTLMFFEGCPKPLGCTILLKGAPGDELKKVKHVVQLGIFAAYQLAVETSYLADERVMPELSLKSPINVALPDETLNINRSISTVSDLVTPTSERLLNENSQLISQVNSSIFTNTVPMSERCQTGSMMTYNDSLSSSMQSSVGDSSRSSSHEVTKNMFNDLSQDSFSEFTSKIGVNQFPESHITSMNLYKCLHDDYAAANSFNMSGSFGHDVGITNNDGNALTEHDPSNPGNLSDSNSRDLHENVQPLKEEFPASPTDDKKSILVSLTTRCVSKGDVCERAHLFRIQYYRNFDKPLGRFLQDDLFDQSYLCRVCEMPPEAHIHCYTHQQGSLTISVKRNPRGPLPGESKGKIWMWHRCCRCPRMRGCPPATRRVPMSDAAWGLSFGKFLELSFSNHAAASRVASCGHSLHKDCLRFYGCGWMVACFRYAPIIVHSVYLPPSKLEFTCTNLEWIEKEANEVRNQAGELYDKVCNVINEISDKYLRSGLLESSTKACGLRKHITELETKLKEEKEYFEESLKRAFERQAGIDILEINKLRRHLLIDSYKWDQILIDTDAKITQEETPNGVEKTNMDGEPAKEVGSCGSIISDGKIEINNGQGLNIKHSSEQDSCSGNIILDQETMCKEKGDVMPNGVNMGEADPVNSNNSVRRVISAGQLPIVGNSSVIIESIESAWVCGKHSGSVKPNENDTRFSSEKHIEARDEMDIHRASSLALPPKSADSLSNSTSWLKVPFINIYQSPEKSTSLNAQKLDAIGHYNPKFVTSFRELVCPGGARLLFSVGFDNTVVPVYDDEPTSIIAYALVSPEYQTQMSDDPETKKDGIESTISLPSTNSVNSLPEAVYAQMRSFRSAEEGLSSMAGSRSSANLDPSFYTKAVHARVHFSDNGLLGKVNYTVTCYFAKRFEALRKISCPTEMDFIRSLSRCKKWGAQGGKSNVFFAKTLDDRFIIKQVTKTELDSFFKFAPDYFKYLSESINSSSPTCLAKILGIFQVTSKHMKGGRECKMDVLVMENLLFRRNVKILYDLKGSCRSRYNPNSSGGNNVLLDQNLLQTMSTSPIFVGNKAKRLLERAVWNDTSFLASIHVMDYSLLVGIDEEKRELVVGIIDFMRQYTWDKHLETWVKASGILGGPKNAQPTVISPDQYKKRFRKAMTTYFLMVPDQWTPPTIIPAELSDPSEENSTILASP